MTYKQFFRWCNDRANDGCWGYQVAIPCLNIIADMEKTPFWKRKKKWKEYEQEVLTVLVNPTNEKIKENIGVEVVI